MMGWWGPDVSLYNEKDGKRKERMRLWDLISVRSVSFNSNVSSFD
jgi:hypothetical protein